MKRCDWIQEKYGIDFNTLIKKRLCPCNFPEMPCTTSYRTEANSGCNHCGSCWRKDDVNPEKAVQSIADRCSKFTLRCPFCKGRVAITSYDNATEYGFAAWTYAKHGGEFVLVHAHEPDEVSDCPISTYPTHFLGSNTYDTPEAAVAKWFHHMNPELAAQYEWLNPTDSTSFHGINELERKEG